MKYGSICSGIEAASAAWEPLGMRPALFAEIDRFPSAVLRARFPSVKNAGDFTLIERGMYDDIDLLVGGTPCQDFSVAGKRAGFGGSRGSLTFAFVDLVRRLRPTWLVWENVPGVLGGDLRRGFFRFVRELSDLGYGCCWRVLDAQYVRVDGLERAVPQRRRRVFVVGCLGGWPASAAVLFEPESVRGDSAPRRQAGQGFARDTAGCLASRRSAGGGLGTDMDIDGGLVAQALRGIGFAESHANAGGQVAVAFKNGDEDASTSEKYAIEILRALRGQVGEEAFAEWRSGILDSFQSPEVLRQAVHGIGVRRAAREEKVLVDDGALACPENMPEGALLHLWQDGPDGRSPQGRELAQQLARESGAPVPFLSQQSASFMQVRRITPLETERLQGFPDYWTAIEGRARVIDGPEADYLRFHGFPVEARANGKLYTTIAADGPRYKALGNSMAVNCMRWIGQRILAVDGILRENET